MYLCALQNVINVKSQASWFNSPTKIIVTGKLVMKCKKASLNVQSNRREACNLLVDLGEISESLH